MRRGFRLAWNPSANSGILGKLLGERKTVIRGGFAMVYDRGNTVQSVEIPMLGIGFDENIIIGAPPCTATGAGGAGCSAAAGVAANPGLASFRVGTDGTLPLPVATAASIPIVPTPGQETLSFQVDPNMKVGRSYNFDFSFQRELPGSIILEAAYIGRMARNLPQAVNVNSAPYMFVDTASNQSFAQAFDAVANALRAGQAAPNRGMVRESVPRPGQTARHSQRDGLHRQLQQVVVRFRECGQSVSESGQLPQQAWATTLR